MRGGYENVFFILFLLFDERGRRISQMNFIGTILVSWEMDDWNLFSCKSRRLNDESRDSLN
jgi:hypothetical protein